MDRNMNKIFTYIFETVPDVFREEASCYLVVLIIRFILWE